MEQDFNPFDLSRIPPKPTEVAKPTEPQAPKPTVRRISMEPLFHSRITKGLAFILGLVLCFLIGYSATSYTLNKREVAESVKVKKDRHYSRHYRCDHRRQSLRRRHPDCANCPGYPGRNTHNTCANHQDLLWRYRYARSRLHGYHLYRKKWHKEQQVRLGRHQPTAHWYYHRS